MIELEVYAAGLRNIDKISSGTAPMNRGSLAPSRMKCAKNQRRNRWLPNRADWKMGLGRK